MKKNQQKGPSLFEKLISAETKALANKKTFESPAKPNVRVQTAPPKKA